MAFRRFLLLISAAPVLLAAGEFQQKQILMEDFESGANWECASKNAAATRDNSSVIFGESSLVCRAPKNSSARAFAFSTSDFNVLEVDFAYKNLKNTRSGPIVLFKDKNGKILQSRNESTFAHSPGDVEKSKCVFHGRRGEKCTVEVIVPRGGEFSFDDISIKGSLAPARADWSVDTEKEFSTCRNNPFASHYLKPDDPVLSMSRDEFFPYIDRWGQYKHRQWTDKVNSDADLRLRAEQESQWARSNPPIAGRDKYFGLLDSSRKYEATGKFRAQKIDGKWFFINLKNERTLF